MVPLDDLAGALVDLHGAGLRIVGAEESAALSYREADLRGPLALVVGSEGHGLSATVRRRVDLVVRIPMRGRVASLNAAVAGSVLLVEAAAQRDLPARDPAADDGPVAHRDAPPEEVIPEPAELAAAPATTRPSAEPIAAVRVPEDPSGDPSLPVTEVGDDLLPAEPPPRSRPIGRRASLASPGPEAPEPPRASGARQRSDGS
jgi:hypothetical protein